MKKGISYIFLSLVFFAISVPMSISFYRDYQVSSKGHIVEVIVKAIPQNFSSKTEFVDFEMDGKTYSKKMTKGESGDLYRGEKINLKFLDGYENNFLFPNEKPIFTDGLCILVLIFFGILSLFTAFKKMSEK